MKLTVVSARHIDREKLRVRINDQDRPGNVKWYDYVKIKVRKDDKVKVIVCKLHGDKIREIKPRDRKASLIYINEPLRYKLGVEVRDNLDFEIKKKLKWLAWYYFIRYHPDDTVIVSTWLGIIAVLISIASLVIASRS